MIYSARDFVERVSCGEISVLEHAEKICSEIEAKNNEYFHFNCFQKDYVISQAELLEKEIKKGRSGKLLGVPVSVKDCLCVKGLESRAGSRILSGYKPVFDATAVARAKSEGAIILGKTSQDEFGFGTFSIHHTAGNVPLNPLDKTRSCGGSSGGAAGFAALTENTHVAIAESTGGSIACPASFCGVSSITPTYGVVSRYGLMDYTCSLDKIGAIGKSIDDASLLLEVMSGKDERDSTSADFNYYPAKFSKMNLGVPTELIDSIENSRVKKVFWEKVLKAEELGCKISNVSLPLNAKYGVAVYYLIAMSEASTNLAKYCGMRYGFSKKLVGDFNEYFSSVRSDAFGEEAKRRIIIGTFARMSGFRDAYYLKAMKVRTKLINEFKRVFSQVDLVVSPSMPMVAPKFSEIEKLSPLENYAADLCTVPPNLGGFPHATTNAGKCNGLPVGLMAIANHFEDAKAVSFVSALEGLM